MCGPERIGGDPGDTSLPVDLSRYWEQESDPGGVMPALGSRRGNRNGSSWYRDPKDELQL